MLQHAQKQTKANNHNNKENNKQSHKETITQRNQPAPSNEQTMNQTNNFSNNQTIKTRNNQTNNQTTTQRRNLILNNKQLPIDRPRRLLCYNNTSCSVLGTSGGAPLSERALAEPLDQYWTSSTCTRHLTPKLLNRLQYKECCRFIPTVCSLISSSHGARSRAMEP